MIDFHLAWCGACNIIEQNYRSLYLAYENAEHRIAFYNAQQDVIPQEIYSALKYGPLTCKPRFAIFIVSIAVLADSGRAYRKEKRRRRLTAPISLISRRPSRMP